MKNKIVMKAVTVLAAGTLAFGLTACTSNTTEDTENEIIEEITEELTDNETTTDENTEEETTDETSTLEDTEGEEPTEGAPEAVSITVEIKDVDGNVTSFTGYTDDAYLFDALSDLEGLTYDGYDADWGYYITTFNDIATDYDNDGSYWALYVNGEYGMNGVETQPVAEGDVFTFAYEVYVAE